MKLKPKLNQTVYLIGNYSITKEKAAYLGKNSFIVSAYYKYVDELVEQRYDDYGITWETTLKAAKAHFKKVEKLQEDYWEEIDCVRTRKKI